MILELFSKNGSVKMELTEEQIEKIVSFAIVKADRNEQRSKANERRLEAITSALAALVASLDRIEREAKENGLY